MGESKAWVIAVDMGYGPQRAAYPFRDIAFERIITANTDPGAFNGFLHVPSRGTENIKRVMFATDRSKVELEAVPPALRDPRFTSVDAAATS